MQERRSQQPPLRWYAVALRRWTSEQGIETRQIVIAAYNAIMAEASARCLAPEASSAYVMIQCPESGLDTQAEAERLIASTRWRPWPR